MARNRTHDLATQRGRYQKRKRLGVCFHHPDRPALPGSSRCQECREKYAKQRLERIAKRKAAGLCVRCGSLPRNTGELCCATCYERQRLRAEKRSREFRSKGYCYNCGIKTYGKARCRRCLQLSKINSQRCIQRKKEEGRCTRCGNNKEIKKIDLCETCSLKVIASRVFRSVKMWTEIKRKFEQQGRRCVYTGKKLQIGVNASLDHIIPKSLGGPDDLDNLQWTLVAVNQMKLDRSEKEFLHLVRDIYKHSIQK